MQLRILMASDFYPPFIGGAERQVQLLSRELSLRGHHVDVATVWHKGLQQVERDAGVTVHRLKGLATSVPWFSSNPDRRYHPPMPDIGLVWGLRRLIRKLKPDIVHCHGWILYSGMVATLGTRIPLMASVRDYGYSCATRTMLYKGQICSGPAPAKCLSCAIGHYGTTKGLFSVAGVIGGRLLLTRNLSAAHSVSSYVQRVVQQDILRHRRSSSNTGRNKIPDIVIPSFLESVDEGYKPDDYAHLLPKEPFILFVGALQRHKGIQLLLDAYAQIDSPPPLVLIGTPWHDTPAFPSNVTVLHNLPHWAVMQAWERCLFGVAPSIWPDPLPGVVREAMVKGKPVIATAVGGNFDMVQHGVNGLLVRPNDVSSLAHAMRQLIADSALRQRLGNAAQQSMQAFSADAVVPQFERLYARLLARQKSLAV